MLEPNSPWHGTSNGYARYGCRCASCVTARSQYVGARKIRVKNSLKVNDTRHGTSTGIQAGCLCSFCISARKTYRKGEHSRYARNAKQKYSSRSIPQIESDRIRLRPLGLKKCNRCYQEQNFDAFSFKASEPDGLRSYCDLCETERKREQRYGDYKTLWLSLGIEVGTCALCNSTFDHVDHIYPRSSDGPDESWNLQPLCASHNLSKNANQPEEYYLHLMRVPEEADKIKVQVALDRYLKLVKPQLIARGILPT